MTFPFGVGLIAATGALAVVVWYFFAVYISPEAPLDPSETLVIVIASAIVVGACQKMWAFATSRPAVERKAGKKHRGKKR